MLPQDPFILLSVVNTQLRDRFPNLEDLCAEHGVTPDALQARLKEAGFTYDPNQNQFR